MNIRKSAVLALLLLLALAGCTVPAPPAPDDLQIAASTDCYRAAGGSLWVCGDGGEMQFESGSTLDVQSGTTVDFAAALDMNSQPVENIGATGTDFDSSGGLTLATGLTLSAGLDLNAGASITVTNGAAFTATAAIQPIAAAGAVTPTITIPAAGNMVCLYNSGSQTINIADTGNQVLTAAWAAGQYDWLCGWSDGTRFMETGRADN